MKITIGCACLALILASGSAEARYHCGHGRIYRVSMDVCVGEHSHLARVAFSRRHHPRLASLPPQHHHRVIPSAQDGKVSPAPPSPTSEAETEPMNLPDAFGRSSLRASHFTAWRLP